MAIELDYMEYANDGAAQAAYVSSDAGVYTSQYPTQDTDHVKATTYHSTFYYPHFATDPAKSLIGTHVGNTWISLQLNPANQRFHIDLGSAKIITRIYYENYHGSGANTDVGAQNFTFWGSNEASDFAELTYAEDGTWTEITPAQSTFDEHVGLNQADPKYITVTNSTAYRYYAFKFADNHGDAEYVGLRRVELQTLSSHLQCYSESTIVQEGTYSLKGTAAQTDSLNDTLTRTVSPTINLFDLHTIKLDVRASRTGSQFKIGIHDSGGTTTEHIVNITAANTWQIDAWDISKVVFTDKDVIDSIIITITNADSANTFYIDNVYAEKKEEKDMADLKEKAPALLSTTTVKLDANADTALYTVPTGKVCVLHHAVLVIGADASTTDISIGQNSAETDFVPATDLANLDAANDACILEPIMATTSVPKIEAYAAATIIEAKVTNQAGGATNTLYLFGFLYDA